MESRARAWYQCIAGGLFLYLCQLAHLAGAERGQVRAALPVVDAAAVDPGAALSGRTDHLVSAADESARSALERALDTLTHQVLADSPLRGKLTAAALLFYHERGYRPAWSEPGQAAGTSLRQLRKRIRPLLKEHGLSAEALVNFDSGMVLPQDCPIRDDDLVVTLTLLEAGFAIRFGPRDLPIVWENYRSNEEEVEGWFASMVERLKAAGTDPLVSLEAGAPGNLIYQSLVTYYRENREALERTGADFVPLEMPAGTSAVKPGNTYLQASRLSARLVEEGFLEKSGSGQVSDGEIFTPELSRALSDFQKANQLNADGVLGSRSLAALNLGPEEKLMRLAVNLQRARYLPDDLGARAVFANIPAGEVEAFDGGKLKERMRIVFGQDRQGRRTPIFHDTMKYVVFRPYWRVPPGIVTNEIAPETIKDPMSFYRKGYEIVEGFGDASVLSPTWENLAAAAQGRLRIRQKPGRGNALGLVKFLFPNPHSVYMHDTPQGHLFAKDRRDFSHGCIRLHHPEKMARYVLGGQGWDELRIKEAMEGNSRRSVTIEKPVRVFIVYFTAWPDQEAPGSMRWTPDVYDRDERMWKAISLPGGVVAAGE